MNTMKRLLTMAVILSVLATASFAAAPVSMSVQVRNGQLRATPSFLGKIVTAVAYADQVSIVATQGEWKQVTNAGGKSGWIHQSALSAKKIVIKAGSEDVTTTASGQELALAGKGFNSDVEADFKSKNKNVDFSWIDKMEKIKVTPNEIIEFLNAGGVKPREG